MAHGTRDNIFWRVWLVFSWCLLAMACSDVAMPTEPAALTGATPASEGPSNQAMTKGLREAVKQARQEDASDVYAAVRDEVGRIALKNPAQRFATTVDASGIVVTAEESPWTWSLRTTAAGCDGAERAVRESEPAVDGNRVTYGRGEFEEWYLNGPMGFEQGFTWPSAPGCAGTKSIRMQVDGDLAARLNAAGDAVELIDGEGRAVLRYADLSVMDATGKTLSAWMTVGAGEWALHWEDEGATYPVVVDPLMTTQEAKLLSGDTGARDYFGSSVALSEDGQTAIVGAPDDDDRGDDAGAAYIWELSNGSWTQQAKLTASDGAAYDTLGVSVAISGDTVLVGAQYAYVGGTYGQGSAYVFVRNGATWTEQKKLTASDGAASDFFGSSVALSGDTALVGARNHDIGTNDGQGSAYVFVRNGTTWSQQAKLTASDGAADDSFGESVALSGDTALVGAYDDDIGTNNNQGSAYVFTRSGVTWTEQQKLTSSDGAADDHFGDSVALSGDTALVGALGDDIGTNNNQGSAYVFFKPMGGSWPTTETAKLIASDGAADDYFGSVAVSGHTALVGARNHDIGTNNNQGSAYVFVKPANGWMTTNAYDAKLTASDGAAEDNFGSVALSGDTALVGASRDDDNGVDSGSVYIFTKPPTGWAQTSVHDAKFTATNGPAGDFFGDSVALSGDTALVGASYDDKNFMNSGAVFVFVRYGTTWTRQAKLTASDGAASDYFGYSVALSGDTAIVGAIYDDDAGPNSGSAYVFVRSGTAWTQQAKLMANDGAASDYFGRSVALSGDTALVGASGADVGSKSGQGSAYVFVHNGTTWSQEAKLTANDGAVDDYFGYSVALSGDTALVGARFDDIGTKVDQGSAYVFVKPATGWADTAVYDAKLTASDGSATDDFGESVALSGDTALVGAYDDDIGTNPSQGSAYVFVKPAGGSWPTTETAKLMASDGAANDYFGGSVALSGDTALVGAYSDNIGTNPSQGSAYVFIKPPAGWKTTNAYDAKLTASDGAANDNFGSSVALSEDGNFGWVGAPYTDDPEPNAGAAYVFSFIRSLGLSCTSAVACETGFCVDGVCCNSLCDGSCQSCVASTNSFGTSGFCGPAKEGLDPHDSCDDSRETDPSSCGTTGVCSAFGSCAVYAYGESCGDPQCTDSNVAQEDFCNGVGACVAVTHDCKTYACDAGVCKSGECTTDTDCAADAYCNKNLSPSTCDVKKNLGDTCSPETKECKSGFCVDGVCCNEPCDSPCQACAASLKQLGTNGYCGPAKQGTVDDNCQADPGKPCGSTGQCNEFGACEIRAYGVNCGQSICQGDIEYDEQICNGFGSCVPSPSNITSCYPRRCDDNGQRCLDTCTKDTDCAEAFVCEDGNCHPKQRYCKGNFDCQENEDCDPNTLLCIPKSTSTMPAESCDCQMPGQPSSPSRWPLVAITSTLVALRRLRARNPATHHRRAA